MQRREFLTQAAAGLVLATEVQGAAPDSSSPQAPVSDLRVLEQAVQQTLDSKRLGQVVFVRYLLQGPHTGDAALARLAHLTRTVSAWTGQPLRRMQAVGTPETGQVSLALVLARGASALVGYARGEGSGDGVHLLVLGSHGSLSHGPSLAAGYPSRADLADPEGGSLLAVIRAALERGPQELPQEK